MSLTCATIKLAQYTNANCSGKKSTCIANGDTTACTNATCDDVTTNCSAISADCVATASGSACFIPPNLCS